MENLNRRDFLKLSSISVLLLLLGCRPTSIPLATRTATPLPPATPTATPLPIETIPINDFFTLSPIIVEHTQDNADDLSLINQINEQMQKSNGNILEYSSYEIGQMSDDFFVQMKTQANTRIIPFFTKMDDLCIQNNKSADIVDPAYSKLFENIRWWTYLNAGENRKIRGKGASDVEDEFRMTIVTLHLLDMAEECKKSGKKMNYTLLYPEAHWKSISRLLNDPVYRKDTVAFYAQRLNLSDEEKKCFLPEDIMIPLTANWFLPEVP